MSLKASRGPTGAGRFTYKAPAGSSRALAFAYRGNSTYRRSDAGVLVTVPASATMKASRKRVRNGQAVRFSGKLLGRPHPLKGKVIDLQAFYRKKWRTFATVRTNKKTGAYAYRYRFEATRGTVVYKFRVRVRASSDYAYATGYSKTTAVTVKGR